MRRQKIPPARRSRSAKSKAARHRRVVRVFRVEQLRAPVERRTVRHNPFPDRCALAILALRSLRCYFKGAGGGCGDPAAAGGGPAGAAGAPPTDLTSFTGCVCLSENK